MGCTHCTCNGGESGEIVCVLDANCAKISVDKRHGLYPHKNRSLQLLFKIFPIGTKCLIRQLPDSKLMKKIKSMGTEL